MVKGSNKARKTGNRDLQRKEDKRLREERVSTSISTKESLESLITFCEAEVEEETREIDNVCETDSQSELDGEPEYEQHKSLVTETDFFQVFGKLPDVDNISEDISEDATLFENLDNLEVALQVDSKTNVGKLVVPPSRGLDVSVSSLSVKDESPYETEAEIVEEQKIAAYKSEESELLLPADTLDFEEKTKSAIKVDTLEVFMKLKRGLPTIKTEEIDWKAVMRHQEVKHVQQTTLKFLTELIDKVVELAELLSPEKYLQENLDKRKLLSEIDEKVRNYYAEKSVSAFLNRQAVLYFRRKNFFRLIMEDNPKTLKRDKEKLQMAKQFLDNILAKETALNNTASQLQADLRAQYNQFKQETDNQIEMFETKARSHLCRDNRPKLNSEIDRLLLNMEKYRQEISEVRFSLLLQQDTEFRLEDLIYQMEGLGSELNMKSFTTVQAENQTLEKKIEERNSELKKLHLRCHNNIHTLANYKENQNMLHDTIKKQKRILNDLLDEKLSLREHVFSLKLRRNQIHAKLKKLSAEGGLLDKPTLMIDYDNTVKIVEEKKEKINYLRQIVLLTQRKIDYIVDHGDNEKKE